MSRNRLHLIEAGAAQLDEGGLFTPGFNEGLWVTVPIPVFVVETPGAVVLIDTGVNRILMTDPLYSVRGRPIQEVLAPRLDERQYLPAALAAAGFQMADISLVVNTHLHWDHAGNNRLFPNVPIVVQARHYEYALDKAAFYPEFWQDDLLDYQLIDGDLEIVSGVRSVVADGHVPGFQAILIEGRRGDGVLLCGDAINSEQNLRLRAFSTEYNHDAVKAAESAVMLEEIAERTGSRMIFGHDSRQWPGLARVLEV